MLKSLFYTGLKTQNDRFFVKQLFLFISKSGLATTATHSQNGPWLKDNVTS